MDFHAAGLIPVSLGEYRAPPGGLLPAWPCGYTCATGNRTSAACARESELPNAERRPEVILLSAEPGVGSARQWTLPESWHPEPGRRIDCSRRCLPLLPPSPASLDLTSSRLRRGVPPQPPFDCPAHRVSRLCTQLAQPAPRRLQVLLPRTLLLSSGRRVRGWLKWRTFILVSWC